MILRGAIVSDERCTLEAPKPASTARPAPDVSRFYSSALQGFGADEPSPVLGHSSALTLDEVTTWLAMCTDTERTSLASLLALDIEQLRKAAREEGYEAGQARALKDAQTRTESVLSALGALTQAAELAFEKDVAQLAAQCAEIVSEVLVKIAGKTLATPEAALGSVLQVLSRLKEEREVLIRVSAVDLPVLQTFEAELTQALAGKKFSLQADSRVEIGGCIVESQLGSLDGRLDIQLRALCETIRAAKCAPQEAR